MTPDRAWVPVLLEKESAWVCAECEYVEEYRTSKHGKWKPAAALEPWEWLILRDDTEFRIRRDVDAQKRN